MLHVTLLCYICTKISKSRHKVITGNTLCTAAQRYDFSVPTSQTRNQGRSDGRPLSVSKRGKRCGLISQVKGK